MLLSPERIQGLAWSLTLLLECGGLAALWLPARIAPPPLRRALWTVAAVNAVTHPLFWLALRRLPHLGSSTVLLAETVVTGVEAALYAWLLHLHPIRALSLSLSLNLLSWLGGIALWQRLVQWHLI